MPVPTANVQKIRTLRAQLAEAERMLRENAERQAQKLADAEHIAWREAQDACFTFDRIRGAASARLGAIQNGESERFLNERKLAEMALRDADRFNAAYTVISFAPLRDRLRYLRGGAEREAVVCEALERGGVYTEACGGRYFQGIVR
jgi:hypothetical protein